MRDLRDPAWPERVLCVAAHPDDEVLGAGATMAALADRGCEVHAVVLGEGVGARVADNVRPDDEVATLSEEFRQAAAIIGATPHQFDLPDNRFDSLETLDVVKLVEEVRSGFSRCWSSRHFGRPERRPSGYVQRRFDSVSSPAR